MLRIDRKPSEKLRLRGKVYGTMTVQLCNKEMRNIWGTSVVVRLEAKNQGQTFIPVYSDKWNRYGDIEMRQSGDGVTFLIHAKPEELQVLRAELIGGIKDE